MDDEKDSRMSLARDDVGLPGSMRQSHSDGAAMTLAIRPSPASKPFPFLSLPPEIRNAVYQYPCIYRTKSSRMDLDRGWIFTDLSQAPITLVNKQLRRETLPIFYENHKFVFEVTKAPEAGSEVGRVRPALEHIRQRFRDFNPLDRHPLTSNLRFLSHVTVILESNDSDIWRLGFTMSSKALVQDELAYGELLVDTEGVDWDNFVHVGAAYIHWLKSSELYHDVYTLFDQDAVSCPHADIAVVFLSALMCFISGQCPQLTSSVVAIIEPNQDCHSFLRACRMRALRAFSTV